MQDAPFVEGLSSYRGSRHRLRVCFPEQYVCPSLPDAAPVPRTRAPQPLTLHHQNSVDRLMSSSSPPVQYHDSDPRHVLILVTLDGSACVSSHVCREDRARLGCHLGYFAACIYWYRPQGYTPSSALAHRCRCGTAGLVGLFLATALMTNG